MSKRPLTRIGTIYTCMTCSIQFRPHKYTSKYCSHSCRPAWNKGLTRDSDSRVIAPWEGKKRPDFPKGIPHYGMRGEGHHAWKKDRNLLVKSEKKHLDGNYKYWMMNVKKRDEWKCRISNYLCNGRLEAHHILDWVNFPESRYDVNNGITLCRFHHPKGRNEEKRLVVEFQQLVSALKV